MDKESANRLRAFIDKTKPKGDFKDILENMWRKWNSESEKQPV